MNPIMVKARFSDHPIAELKEWSLFLQRSGKHNGFLNPECRVTLHYSFCKPQMFPRTEPLSVSIPHRYKIPAVQNLILRGPPGSDQIVR